MENGVYIFKDSESFINQIELIANEYTSEPKTIKLHKVLNNTASIRREFYFIKQCTVNSADSFYTSKIVKIHLTDWHKCNINITYSFNGSKYLFAEFKRYFKKDIENIYI